MSQGSERQGYFERNRVSRATGDDEPHFPENPRRSLDLRRIFIDLIQHTPLRRFVRQAQEVPQPPQNPQE